MHIKYNKKKLIKGAEKNNLLALIKLPQILNISTNKDTIMSVNDVESKVSLNMRVKSGLLRLSRDISRDTNNKDMWQVIQNIRGYYDLLSIPEPKIPKVPNSDEVL